MRGFTHADGRRVTKTWASKGDADAWLAKQRSDAGMGIWVDPQAGKVSLGR